jgi:hypothetical protein
MISHDNGVILVCVPYSGADIFENCYMQIQKTDCISSFDTKRLPDNKILTENTLGNTIRKFHDYDLFAIVKSPYQRAYEMWMVGQSKLKKSRIGKQTIGEYYENLLNGWDCVEGDKIQTQVEYLKSDDNNTYFGASDVNFKVENLYHYEDLIKNKFDGVNDFLSYNDMNNLSYYIDYDYDETWRENYDKNSIDIVNYVFDEDFSYCGYGKI